MSEAFVNRYLVATTEVFGKMVEASTVALENLTEVVVAEATAAKKPKVTKDTARTRRRLFILKPSEKKLDFSCQLNLIDCDQLRNAARRLSNSRTRAIFTLGQQEALVVVLFPMA